MRLQAALDGFCTLVDASDLVSRLRLVKSPAEIAYVRKAAELADLALDEAHRLAGPGADEGEILAAMQGAVIRGGGDDPANEFIIGSGADALLCRYFTGRRTLDAAGPADARVRRRLSPLPFLPDAHDPDRRAAGRASARCTRSRSTRSRPARRR